MGEDLIGSWLAGQQPSADPADPIGSWLTTQRRPAPQTPAPGFFDAFSKAFLPQRDLSSSDVGRERLSGFVEGATEPAERIARRLGHNVVGLGQMLTTPPSTQAQEMGERVGSALAGGPAIGPSEAVTMATGIDPHDPTHRYPEIAADVLTAALAGKFLEPGERAERPVAVRPDQPRAPRGGEATPARPIARPELGLPETTEPPTATIEQRALPPHEPPGLPPARGPIVPPAPAGPVGLLPERGGGPFESPGEQLPPRIHEASRYRPTPIDTVEEFLNRQRPPDEPPPGAAIARPRGPQPPAPLSDLDLVARRLGYRNTDEMMRQQPDLARRIADQPPASRPRAPEPPAAPPAVPPVVPIAPKPPVAPPTGTDAVASFLGRQEPPVEPLVDREADEAWPTVLDDARKQGYTGSDDELRRIFDERVRSARQLQSDMRSVVHNENPAGARLLQEIARVGGLRFDPDHPLGGELADMWESMDTGTTGKFSKRGAAVSQRGSSAGLGNIGAIMRRTPGGLLPADLAEYLSQDPQFRSRLGDRPGELDVLGLMQEAVDSHRQGLEKVPSFGEALRFADVESGMPWWDETQLGHARAVESLGPTNEQTGYKPSPFESIDQPTYERIRANADLSNPTLERVPLNEIVGTQDTLTPSRVRELMAEPPADLAEIPASARGRFDPDATTVIRGDDGRYYMTGGHHRAAAAMLRGEPDIQAVVYPTKGAATAPTAIPRNLRDFLVRQLGIPADEVAAMTPEQATALGESVRTHPEGVQAGIRANRRLPPENLEPVPPLQVAGRGELNAAARRRAMMATAVPRSAVDVPRGTPTTTETVPRRTVAQRLSAGETLTEGERAEAGLPPTEAPERRQYTPSELGQIQSGIREAARERARLLEAGTPESLSAYEKSLANANDRQTRRELVHDRPEPPKRTGRGEILAGGLGPFGALGYAPEAWRQLREMAPDVARVIRDLLPERAGGKPGKPIGTQELRRPPTPGKDIHPLAQVAHPNYALPDLWQQIRPELQLAHDAMGEDAPPGVDKATWAKVTHDLWHGDVIKTTDEYATQAQADGRPRAAAYARALSAQFRGLPTLAERIAETMSLGQVSPVQARRVFRAAENVLYSRLFLGAVDTGILTRSQVLAAFPHLGWRGVVEGLREGRTPEGQALAEGVTNLSPVDTALSKKIPNNAIRKIVNVVTNPVGVAHRANRRDTFLSGFQTAVHAGESPERAKEFGYDLQELVHGSPMSTNPYLRHVGPLRMLSKYPIVMSQFIHSVVTHPDPGVRRRGIGFVTGAAALSGIFGVSLLDYFLPHLRTVGGPMVKIVQDLWDHATGGATHSWWEDIDPRRGGTALTGRYPEKVYRTVRDIAEHGLGTHTKESMQGEPVGETSGVDELANLLGLHSRYGLPDILGMRTSNEADRQAALDEAENFIKQAERTRNISGRLAREDVEMGDESAMQDMTPAQQRAYRRSQQETAFQALLRRVPVADREEFIRRFSPQFSGGM